MNAEDFFQALDLDKDGFLSREELRHAAHRLEWGWRDAPYLAVFDLLTLREPLSKRIFLDCLIEIMRDPAGPYGRVLLRATPPEEPYLGVAKNVASSDGQEQNDGEQTTSRPDLVENDAVTLLQRIAGSTVSDEYRALLEGLAPIESAIDPAQTALFIIDPQRSFTEGTWMRSIGQNAEREVMPILLAFRRCVQRLQEDAGRTETMFSRCPFPADSYCWDRELEGLIHERQPYFVKPGNSILWPPTNGFKTWVDGLIDRDKTALVFGGCTLNSCVRISAIEVQQRFASRGLQVLVDLSLCGGRRSNYIRSAEFGGRSSAEAAVREMQAAGVLVASSLDWPAANE